MINILKNNVDKASKFCKEREKIIERFKNRVFSLYYHRDNEEQMKFEKEEKKSRLMEMGEIEGDNTESNHSVSKYFFVPKLKHLLEYFNRNKNDPKKIIT